MQELGFNYRISDINCALGLSQLENLENFKLERTNIVKFYDNACAGLNYLNPLKKLQYSDTAWHLYVVLIDFDILGKSRAQVMTELKEKGIGTQVHYIPLHKQPYYKNLCGEMTLPGAEGYYATCLSLPLYVGLKEEDQQHVVDALSNA